MLRVMRIVAGAYKGRGLVAPKGRATRPTSERTREAIFNVLAHASWAPDLVGARVIDLFAGSGALGLEALSRGASFALFVEADAAARGAIRTNAEALGVMGVTRIHRRDAAELGEKPAGLGAPFDLAFLDPPYGRGLAPTALARLRSGGWLAPDAGAVVETGHDEPDLDVAGFALVDSRRYGEAKASFLRRAD
jgi:16S rRNA (guanine966-N2)-methyltransferase